ncbi:hypothetical protein L3556_12580 [Candidatus Synechococcus calcipolaris G9]|uniref:Uncharacterized protein n=1 Tax=Candidatus Synechococcus calcipolaris G9 TaxID=1497997 RepID=A0ABT6F1M4_9SYNE|nr:hypothetical protein [Candidatus Synechococcus calcipolaris]MDG2991758.1 hypothetical protein [Candidatus Synechococcus calcipolaris G9]
MKAVPSLAIALGLFAGPATLTAIATPFPPIFNPVLPTSGMGFGRGDQLLQEQMRFNQQNQANVINPSIENTINNSEDVLLIEVDGQLLTPAEAKKELLDQE